MKSWSLTFSTQMLFRRWLGLSFSTHSRILFSSKYFHYKIFINEKCLENKNDKFPENLSRPGKIDTRARYQAAARRLRNTGLMLIHHSETSTAPSGLISRTHVTWRYLLQLLHLLVNYAPLPIGQCFSTAGLAAQYRALASIIPGRERPDETTICYKISLI